MEIAPIPGIRMVPAVKPREADTRAPAIFDIEPSSKPNDSTQQRNGKKAAGAEENEEDELALEEEAAAGQDEPESRPAPQVDYFA